MVKACAQECRPAGRANCLATGQVATAIGNRQVAVVASLDSLAVKSDSVL